MDARTALVEWLIQAKMIFFQNIQSYLESGIQKRTLYLSQSVYLATLIKKCGGKEFVVMNGRIPPHIGLWDVDVPIAAGKTKHHFHFII